MLSIVYTAARVWAELLEDRRWEVAGLVKPAARARAA